MRTPLIASGIVVALLAGRSAAQPDPEPKDGRVVIDMTVSPAPTPKPLSRYHLYPEYKDQQPGERVGGFLRSFMEQNVFFNPENTEKRQRWLDMPQSDLPADVREQANIKEGIAYDPVYATKMVFIDQAARYTRVEWNEWFNLRHDGPYTLLPELQKLRDLSHVLRLRMRGEVKNGEFQRATETAKTMLGLAQTCEKHPCLIGNLVGLAIAHEATHGLEEMVRQPGCPNLYWSFTDLPAPLIDLRHGIAGERVFLVAQFDGLLTADLPLSEAALKKHLDRMEGFVRAAEGDVKGGKPAARPVKERFTAWAADPARVEAGRKRLVEVGGFAEDAVKAFPPLQVVLTDDLVRFTVYRDELFKWVNLPYPISRGIAADEEAVRKVKGETVLAPSLVSSVEKVKLSQVRVDQRVAFLRTVEAVRLFAHLNGGRLPATLDEVRVQVPADPVSGKPFRYEVKDGVATLAGENPLRNDPKTNRVYEIRVRK